MVNYYLIMDVIQDKQQQFISEAQNSNRMKKNQKQPSNWLQRLFA
ncbi:hypothetical protein [Peribacillus sp. SCS-155]